MSEIDETTWREQTFGTGKQSALPGILAVANAPTWGELEEERAARAAAAALAERRAKIAELDAANDHPMAKRTQLQQEAGESRNRIADLAEQLSRARQDHERIESNLAYYDRIVGEIQAAAEPPPWDDPVAVAGRRAHAAFVEATRAKIAELETGAPRRTSRPFSVSRGSVARSECCTWCTEFDVPDEASFMLHNDPLKPVPITPPGTVPQAEQERQVREWLANPETAERRTPGRRYAEISR